MKYIFPFLTVCFAFAIIISTTSCNKNTVASQQTTDSLKVGLIAWYPFNNTGADSSHNGNDAMIYNMASTTDRLNRANYAYAFNGTSTYAVVNDNSALRLSSGDFTLNAWVNLNAFNSTSGSFIASKRTSGLNDGWGFSITGYQSGLNIIGGVFFGAGGGNPTAVSSKSIVAGKWNMVTTVYNASKQTVTIYINGVQDNVTTAFPAPSSTITANMYIGTDNPVNQTAYTMNGAIDDFRIYSRALNTATIQKLYVATN